MTRKDSPSTSSSSTERLPVGHVRRAHGIRGAVVVRSLTDAAELRFAPGSRLRTDEDPPRELEVTAAAPHRDGWLVRFSGIDDRDGAETLRGVTLTIAREERRPLAEDEWWPDELEGCRVETAEGDELGVIVGVVHGAAQDRLVVETRHGDRVELPLVDELVPVVDVEARRIVAAPPEGLFPETRSP